MNIKAILNQPIFSTKLFCYINLIPHVRRFHVDIIDIVSNNPQGRASKPSLAVLASGRGDTALHDAVSNGRKEVVELLLAANAPADVYNKSGRGPQFGRGPFGFFLACDRLFGDGNP